MGLWTIYSGLNGWPVQFLWETDMCKLTMEAGMADGGKCQIANFKNTTRVLTIGDVSPDYRCHQYSNLTYPIGIGPLGCEYSTLLYSLSSFCVCSQTITGHQFISGLRQFSHSNTRSCPLSHSEYLGYSAEHIRCIPTRTE